MLGNLRSNNEFMIDTSSKERRESVSNESPNLIFRYCFDLKRVAQLA